MSSPSFSSISRVMPCTRCALSDQSLQSTWGGSANCRQRHLACIYPLRWVAFNQVKAGCLKVNKCRFHSVLFSFGQSTQLLTRAASRALRPIILRYFSTGKVPGLSGRSAAGKGAVPRRCWVVMDNLCLTLNASMEHHAEQSGILFRQVAYGITILVNRQV